MRFLRCVSVSAAILIWFFGNAWRGLAKTFSGDDMMNLHGAWDLPLARLLAANLTPFTKVYRPTGGLFYRALYDAFGLHPFPFRIAIYVLLVLNIAVLFWLAKLVSNSTEVGIVAALVGSYHARAIDIYVSGGTVYDVLCFTFYVLAVCVYIHRRQGGARLSWRWSALVLALNVLALNSKEMAATLFVILAAYDWLYHRSLSLRNSAVVWISFAMTLVAAAIRTSPGTAFYGVGGYERHVSLSQFILTTRRLLDDLFLLPPDTFNALGAVLVFALVWAIAILSRRRDLLLAACMIVVMPLAVNFIDPRGFFVMYLPLAGWATFIAIAAVAARDWLLRWIENRPALRPGQGEQIALFAFMLWGLFVLNVRDPYQSFLSADEKQTKIQNLSQSLARIPHALPRGASVLFVNDAFRPDDPWMPLYVTRLFYGDRALTVDLSPRNRHYDLCLTLCGESYCEVPAH